MSLREKVEARTKSLPVNVEGLIEDVGVDLARKAELDPDISGQIEPIGHGKYRISVNRNDSYYRRRFTMAHELAHFLLHRDLIGQGLDDTPAYRSTDKGRFFNRSVTPEHETEANRLAAELLMPSAKVREEFASADDLLELAKKFQVSAEAMRYRLQSLGLV
jgi:Zn-dependent peptidase ImmA (M78 family)